MVVGCSVSGLSLARGTPAPHIAPTGLICGWQRPRPTVCGVPPGRAAALVPDLRLPRSELLVSLTGQSSGQQNGLAHDANPAMLGILCLVATDAPLKSLALGSPLTRGFVLA